MNEMGVEKWWNEICDRGKREKSREKHTQSPFRPPQNPHGVADIIFNNNIIVIINFLMNILLLHNTLNNSL